MMIWEKNTKIGALVAFMTGFIRCYTNDYVKVSYTELVET